MFNSTTDVYKIKRETIHFSKRLVPSENKVKSKFISQSIYGILRSGSIVLKKVATALDEPIQIKNTIDRLSRHLNEPLPKEVHLNYTQQVVRALGDKPVILVDDSDVIKPYGEKFEALGRVRDGSSKEHKIEKGYHVTEMVGLTASEKQPISLFSQIHSSHECGYKSTNTVLFEGLEQVIQSLKSKGTFIFDRGYDMNSLFEFMHEHHQHFIVRIKENRKLFWKGKWFKSATLRDSRKGKLKTTLTFNEGGKMKKATVYVSHLNIQITSSKTPVTLVLVYGLGMTPMMLVTNKQMCGKEDVIQLVRDYMSRWRVEEYFRFKKQHFDFENFRVRSLVSIQNLNQLLSYTIGFIGLLASKRQTSSVTHLLIHNAKALRTNIQFYYYQIAEGTIATLSYASEGIQRWFSIRRSRTKQLEMKLAA